MAQLYEGIVQQNKEDNFYETKKAHSGGNVSDEKAITKQLCLKDRNSPARPGADFWYQGPLPPNDLQYSRLKCNIIDRNICDLPGVNVDTNVFNPKWADPKFITNGSEDGKVKCNWPKDLFLETPWIKAYTEGISSGSNQKSKIITDGFKKDPNLDEMYTNYCTQTAIARAVLEPPIPPPPGTVLENQGPPPPGTNGTTLIPQTPVDPLLQPIQQIDPNFECPPDTFLGTGENMASCSYFKTTDTKTASDSPQVLCNLWRSKGTLALAEGAIKSYCDTKTTRDCLCLNPSIDPEVKVLFDAIAEVEGEEGGLATSRGCWFLPCDSDSYLITSELEKEKANCDLATKCSQVINIANSKGINLSNIKQFLNCDVDGPPTPSNGGGTILGVSVDVFIIATILVVALIIVIFFVFYSGGTKNSDTKS